MAGAFNASSYGKKLAQEKTNAANGSTEGLNDTAKMLYATNQARQEFSDKNVAASDKQVVERANDIYYNDLGGEEDADEARFGDQFGGNEALRSIASGISDTKDFINGINTKAGGAIDDFFDNTAWAALGQIDEDLGREFQNMADANDVAAGLDLAEDIGLSFIPVAGVPMAVGKNAIQQSDNIWEAITGVDAETGEALSGTERLGNAGLAALSIGTSFIPGSGKVLGKMEGLTDDAAEALGKASGLEGDDLIDFMAKTTSDGAKYSDINQAVARELKPNAWYNNAEIADNTGLRPLQDLAANLVGAKRVGPQPTKLIDNSDYMRRYGQLSERDFLQAIGEEQARKKQGTIAGKLKDMFSRSKSGDDAAETAAKSADEAADDWKFTRDILVPGLKNVGTNTAATGGALGLAQLSGDYDIGSLEDTDQNVFPMVMAMLAPGSRFAYTRAGMSPRRAALLSAGNKAKNTGRMLSSDDLEKDQEAEYDSTELLEALYALNRNGS